MQYLIFVLAVAAYVLSLMWVFDLVCWGLTGEAPTRLVQLHDTMRR